MNVPRCTLILMALSLSGCSFAPLGAAFWGNLAVLGLTFGIFFGTLALGRSSDTTSTAEASTSTGSRS